MAADRASHHLNRRKAPGFVKNRLLVLGLIAVAIVAVALAENMGQPMHAVATAAPQGPVSTSINAANSPDKRLSMDEFLSSNLNDKISSPTSGPRECNPEQGIVNDCTYQ